MTVTYTDSLQLVSFNDLKDDLTIDSSLDSLLPKDDLISVEGEDIARYDYLKEQIKLNGVITPFYIAGLDNKILLIDGLTRWSIVTDLVAEGVIDPREELFRIRLYNGFNSLEEIMSWMWSFNQSVRGAIHRPRLDTIMLGIKYNSSKKPNRGNAQVVGVSPKLQIEGSANTASDIAVEYSVSKSKVERAGRLVRDLHKLAKLFNKPNSYYYYLYEKGLSEKQLSVISGVEPNSKDAAKLEELIEENNLSNIFCFKTTAMKKADEELKLAKQLEEKKEWAEEVIPNLSKLIDFYITGGELSKADILKVSSLFKKVKNADLENITSMAESISSKTSYNNFFSSVYNQYQYLDPSFKVKDNVVKDTVPSSVNPDYSDYEPDYTVDTEEQTYERDKVKIALRHIRSAIQALETCETTLDLEDSLINVELKAEVLLKDLINK